MSYWRIAQLAQQMLSPTAASSSAEQPLRGYPYMLAQQQKRTGSRLTLGASEPLEWFVLNDVVMGGQSESACESDTAGGLTFRGMISTIGGGFCSCRTHESNIAPPADGQAAAVKMKYTCDDALYKLTLSTGSMNSRALSWQFQLPEQGPGTYSATVPLSAFAASMREKDMPGNTLNAAELTSIGLNCSIFDMHGQAIVGEAGGAFEITLHSLEWVEAIDEHDAVVGKS